MLRGRTERGLRPGTQPLALIAALGKAAELATRDHVKRAKRYQQIKERALDALHQLGGVMTGDQSKALGRVGPSRAGFIGLGYPPLRYQAVRISLFSGFSSLS